MDPRHPAPDLQATDLGLGFEPIVCLSSALVHGARAVPRRPGPRPSRRGRTPAAADEDATASLLEVVADAMASAGAPTCVVIDLPGRAWSGRLPEITAQTLARHGVAAAAVGFTLSADDAVHDAPTAAAMVVALRELGCRVGLDGVGAGFGSIHMMSVLPVDFARIEPALVDNMLEDPDALTQASGVLRRATEVGVATMAVGIDTFEHAAWLRDLGCAFGSGACFGHRSNSLVLPTPHRCGLGSAGPDSRPDRA